MFYRRVLPAIVVILLASPLLAQTPFSEAVAERQLRHQTPEWLSLEAHLPNAATATPAALLVAADVLRARRMPEDALEYYRAAIQRGGDQAALLNRIGITQLELHDVGAAKIAFKRALSLKKKDSEGWNNLGAAEYVTGNYVAAVQDYQKAIRLNKKTAVFYSNLGTAYFEMKDFESAQKHFELAVALDPDVFQRGGAGGVQAHILSPADRGRFCFELARLAARHHDDAGVMEWLSKAAETGYDIRYEMSNDRTLSSYAADPRVVMMLHNVRSMRGGEMAAAATLVPLR